MFALADRLNKSLGEVLAMTEAEFACWLAYCRLMDREAGERAKAPGRR